MKAHRETPKPAFIPVTLTLESQAEVDGIYSLMNHTAISDAAELPEKAFETLEPFTSSRKDAIHRKLVGILN